MSISERIAAKLEKLSPEKRALLERRQRPSLTNNELSPPKTIKRRGAGGSVPLSYSQDRLWFLDQLKPGNSVFTLSRALRIRRAVDPRALELAIGIVVSRHEILRTTFSTVDGVPTQIVAGSFSLPVEVRDLRSLAVVRREERGYEVAAEEAYRPFDLATGPLLRVLLLQLDDSDSLIVLAIHHIISDVWSLRLFIRELEEAYESICAGRPAQLPELPIQYGDYALWQRQRRQEDLFASHLDYWNRMLTGAPGLLLPLDHPRPAEQSYRGAQIPFALDPLITGRLAEIGQRGGATLFMVLLAGFYALLSRYTGQKDIVIGSAVAGRDNQELEGLIGFFVNSLVLRGDLSGNPSFTELVARVREMALDAYAHQDLPFEVLVEKLHPRRDLSRHPIFQVTFQLINLPGTGSAPAYQPTEIPRPTSGFDLVFDLWGDGSGIAGRIDYSTDLFNRSTTQRLHTHYQNLLACAAADPKVRISEFPLLSDIERSRVLVQWNDTATANLSDFCLHELVQAQAERTPDGIAVLAGDKVLTFAELNREADILAGRLQSMGVRPDTLVGILIPRSADLVVALLGVLKAGGAYVPLDTDYAPDRQRFILEDSRAVAFITCNATARRLGQDKAVEINLDELLADDSRPAVEVTGHACGSNLAYVLYTSGSTGRPKGVMVEHRALVNHTLWMQSRFPIGPGDRVLQRTPVSFDASVWEFCAPLIAGGTLVMAPVWQNFDHTELARTIRDHSITILQLVPSMLRLLLEEQQMQKCFMLKRVFCGGEALTGELRDRFFSVLPSSELCNLYGPTEACIDATYHVAQLGDPRRNVPIGRPISNMRAYILDVDANLVPVGVAGELYLAGRGLARGYQNQPALTNLHFIPNPFEQELHSLMYRTGDRCRYLESGEIEYLGRSDSQVKIRGIRFELQEIELQLLDHPAVKACAVALRQNGANEGRVAACVLPSAWPVDDEKDLSSRLRHFLRARIPDPCLPSVFLFLESLPLLTNGKIDRAALQSLDFSNEEGGAPYVAPRTETERELTKICQELLPAVRIGMKDNLFELGAHSLLATQIISRIRARLNAELDIQSFFEHPSIGELAAEADCVRQSHDAPVATIARLDREKYRRPAVRK